MRRAILSAAVAAVFCSVASAQTVHFNINAQQDVKPISRFIYGMNDSLGGSNASMNLTMTRMGGNRWTAYNWENNASNAGSDYLFQNDGLISSSNTAGAGVGPTIQSAQSYNAGVVVTVPMAGYVAADKNGGGDVRYTGNYWNGSTWVNGTADPNYLQNRFKVSLPSKGSAFTTNPSKTDGYVYQDEFVNWIKTNYGSGVTANKQIFFSLDNEPDLWASTHAEVHPNAPTYAEMVQRTTDYAKAIKGVMPDAKVFGPVSYGWQGMVDLQGAPDAAGRDFLSTYLAQMKTASTTAGKRLLDVMDVHWYPEAQGGGQRVVGGDNSAAVAAARMQAPRSLWDSTYTETSWITQWSTHGPVNLLHRLQQKIDQNYAGTKMAITEYNYGGGNHISGAIAQADVLGIFGRESVYAASEWRMGSDESYINGAFKMYRNFDGANGSFGDTSVAATTDSVANTSIYASVDANDPTRMVLVAVNKTAGPLAALLDLGDALASRAEVYQLLSSSANPIYAGQLGITDPSSLSYTMPAYSVSTLVLRVPEPTGLSLLGVGLLALRRRRQTR